MLKFDNTKVEGPQHESSETSLNPNASRVSTFILIRILPLGFHRIRHFGILSNPCRVENLRLIRAQITNADPSEAITEKIEVNDTPTFVCPACHAPMNIVELPRRFDRPRAPP